MTATSVQGISTCFDSDSIFSRRFVKSFKSSFNRNIFSQSEIQILKTKNISLEIHLKEIKGLAIKHIGSSLLGVFSN